MSVGAEEVASTGGDCIVTGEGLSAVVFITVVGAGEEEAGLRVRLDSFALGWGSAEVPVWTVPEVPQRCSRAEWWALRTVTWQETASFQQLSLWQSCSSFPRSFRGMSLAFR